MSDTLENAKEALERQHHEHGVSSGAKRIAILISILAVVLAITETAEKGAQNQYLTHHITLSDDWAFYQAKTIRWDLLRAQADALDSLPNAADPTVKQRAAAMRAESARLDDDEKTQGRKQLMERAKQQTELRDHAFEKYERLEWVVGALQIAIVLASVSVVTGVAVLWMVAAGMGAVAGLAGLLVAYGVV